MEQMRSRLGWILPLLAVLTGCGAGGSGSLGGAPLNGARSPSFTLTAGPASQTVTAGESTSYDVTVTGIDDFRVPIDQTVSGLPEGASVTWSQNPAKPLQTGQTNTLTILTTASVVPGTYDLTITGSGGGIVRTADVQVIVVAPAP